MSLTDRVAVITGGTSGIGEATAEVFESEGATVVVSGRSEERGEALVARLGGASVFKRADVTRHEDIKELIDFTEDPEVLAEDAKGDYCQCHTSQRQRSDCDHLTFACGAHVASSFGASALARL